MGLVRENLFKSQRCHSEFDYYMLLLQVMHVIIAGSLLITDIVVLRSGHVVLFKAVDFDWVSPGLTFNYSC